MIDLTCPNCGREGSIPRDKINTRLVCKKCHMVFHMSPAGRTMLGEPRGEPGHHKDGATATLKNVAPRLPSLDELSSLRENVPAVSARQLAIGLAVLVVAYGAWAFFSQPPESLEAVTSRTATRFANDDLAYLKEIATADTIDDVVRWFDIVHPKLVKSREEWKTKNTDVRVMVIDENRRQRTGESQAFVYPAAGETHSAKVSDAASASTSTAPALQQPVDLKLFWRLDGGGHWRLDGRQTHSMANMP